MDLKGGDKHSQNKLDLEFQRILRIIKPYIPCIMNNQYLTSYRTWLEKLNELGFKEKEERNRYLIELCHQIQDGILEEPFIHSPPPGPLPPLRGDFQNNKVPHRFQDLLSKRQSPRNNTFLKSRLNTLQLSPKGVCNLGVPAEAYKKRNRYTVLNNTQNQHSVQHNVIDDALLEFKNSPKYSHPTQFLSESNVIQDKLVSNHRQHFLKKSENFPQKQQHDFTNRYYLKTQGQHNNYMNKNNKGKLFSQQNTLHGPIQKEALETALSMQQELKQRNPQQNSIKINEGDEDDSWCDLTDSSTIGTKFGSGDLLDNISGTVNPPEPDNDGQNYLYEMYDARISDLMNIIAELQKQNLSLNEDVAKYERDLNLRNSKAETSIYNPTDEVKSLKSGLQELAEIKKALKNNHFTVSSQWEGTLNALNKELYISQNQNLILKAEIIDLKKKLEEVSTQKQKGTADPHTQKLPDTHAKEIIRLKQTHAKHVASIEEKLNKILTEREKTFSQRQKDLKNYYENKILDIINEYDKTVNHRNLEIERLESTLEKQCERMHDEVCGIQKQIEENSAENEDVNLEKISLLQKCLWKMDKLFKKSQTKYNKQITKLKHEIEIKDKTIQLQLTTQKAQLLTTTNTKRQVETDAIVILLEERYRKLLERQHAHFLADKKNDAKLISTLRVMLAKNNVTK